MELTIEQKEKLLLDQISDLYDRLHEIRKTRQNEEVERHVDGDKHRTNRVILVTLRLPFRMYRDDTRWKAEFLDNYAMDESLNNYAFLHKNFSCVWIGTLGGDLDPSEQNVLKEQLLLEKNYYPVFLDAKREYLFYSGFCKTVIWPLFHSAPPATDDQLGGKDGDFSQIENDLEKMWQSYVSVNQAFADAIQEVYEDGDLVWIQGYHFSLLPSMVRSLLPNVNIKIGYFMHIPFPSSELYRIMKHREEILYGILAADLIGFQTYEYARHFQSAVVRILGLESSHLGVEFNGHFARVTICPIGIDSERFRSIAASDSVQERIKELETQFEGKKIMLGVDRLDPTKGLVHKFLAIEELLQSRPELSNEIVFIQILVTQPANNSEYQILESQVDEMVARINSKLQDIGGEGPVQYLTRVVPIEELVALYCVTDVLVTTPIRDGMNVVPFEYVVSREEASGFATVILSEFAGCSQSLGGAILVNPWNTEEFAEALLIALDQDEDERMQGHRHMYQYASTFTSQNWVKNFIEQLQEASEDTTPASGRELSSHDISSAYLRSRKRLILLSMEGVLATDSSIPELARPSEELRHWLYTITLDPDNTVVIVSARSASIMEKWFGDLPAILAAEYGVYIRWSINEPWKCVITNLDLSWWEDVIPLLDYYTERTPGAFIERKESAVTWHYRDCDLDHGSWQATELQVTLREVTRRLPISVVPGDKTLEVRPHAVSKVALFERIWEYLTVNESMNESARLSPRSPSSKESFERELKRRSSSCDESIVTGKNASIMSSNIPIESVDFVFVVASGADRTDEDLFSLLIPPHIDLQAYCQQLEKEKEEEEASVHDKQNFLRLDKADIKSRDRIEALIPAPDKLLKLSTATSQTTSVDLLMDTINNNSDTRTISDDAAVKFPPSLAGQTNARREIISVNSKFTPRKDFPPSVALFKALKRKYGDNFGMHKLPDTPAACWALVLPPTARGRVEEADRGNTSSGLSPKKSSSTGILHNEPNLGLPLKNTEDEDKAGFESKNGRAFIEEKDDRKRFPVNTFVCTVGRRISQAPYYVKRKIDLCVILKEMAATSQNRLQRLHTEDGFSVQPSTDQ